jgi:hypothetical protein
MNCIFNELSFAEFVDSVHKLLPAFKELHMFQSVGIRYGHTTYIHRDGLYDTIICGQKFRHAVNLHIENREEKRKILRLLDKSVPVLPDDTAIPTGCLFYCNSREIPCAGLAECAFRLYMGDTSLAYSLSCSSYSINPLTVKLESGTESATVDVLNVTNIEALCYELERRDPQIRCWEDIFQRADRLPHVCIEVSAQNSIASEPFEASLGKTIWERLKIVEKIATSSGRAYTKLIQDYCHGDTAIFSAESYSRISALRDKLYFQVNGERKLCSFHAKIRHRAFRIHMDKQPIPNEIIHIVYIGPKIL